jgi:hypothetical protein
MARQWRLQPVLAGDNTKRCERWPWPDWLGVTSFLRRTGGGIADNLSSSTRQEMRISSLVQCDEYPVVLRDVT